MSTEASTTTEARDDVIEIDLRNRGLAAFLAWCVPGLGHLYQRRRAKGILFMVCILSTYFFGLALGEGRVVYASWTKTDKRWEYIFQLGVGVPALPALIQNRRVMGGKPPLFTEWMAPPRDQPVRPGGADILSDWHKKLGSRWGLATLYTMVAGLLNVLAVYDAFAGPALPEPDEKGDKPPPEGEGDGDGGDGVADESASPSESADEDNA